MKALGLAVRVALVASGLFFALPASAQQQDESPLAGDFRKEGDRFKESCGGIKKLVSCAAMLVTDHPVHLSLGSIAPQNGFAFGPSFGLESNTHINWPMSFTADAVVAPSGAWRAGAYLKFRHTDIAPVGVGGPGTGTSAANFIQTFPIYSIYAQTISLPTVLYYGLGNDSSRSDITAFKMRETIVGGSALVPISKPAVSALKLALLGEINGRFVDVSGSSSDKAPSIEARFTDATAPGLAAQPGFVQFGEGVRITPSLFGGGVRLNYLAQFQQFVATSDSTASSFRRWTVDLSHEFPLWNRSAAPAPPEAYGPNECPHGEDGRCPPVAPVRIKGVLNKTGTVGFRVFASGSGVSDGHAVPFYFQQTLGGSDINGNRVLASYDDYRFRGPHLFLLQETFEHSIAGPIGVWLAADQGRVSLQNEGLTASGLRHTFAAGVSLRAGAAPLVLASWATGGPEGHHIIFTVSTSLLGSSSRPSLH